MISNYCIYFQTLSKQEKLEQVLFMLAFLLVFFAICSFLIFLKSKYLDDTKDSIWQKFLKKL